MRTRCTRIASFPGLPVQTKKPGNEAITAMSARAEKQSGLTHKY